jgi:uncharacterized phiE125 gp8 family phage protein
MPYVLVTPPGSEPVTLEEAKAHLEYEFSDRDLLISSLITAARIHAEMVCQRQFITATWDLVLDAFPGQMLMGVPAGVPFSLPGHAVLLNKSPVQSVSYINYQDMSSTLQTMPPENYTVDTSSDPTRITPIFGQIWQPTLPQVGAVKIRFVAGYGEPDDVPEGIKSWIKLRVATLFQHREEVAVLQKGKLELLPFVDGLLDPYRVVTY